MQIWNLNIGIESFGVEGNYIDTVGKNRRAIAEYIANQLKEDREMEQMTIQEITDPFKK